MLTVITVNKNNAYGLEKTIISLRSQSLQEFQWIFMDGNSSDHSNNLAEEFRREKDILISADDYGIYNAMNCGIPRALGDGILFLNSGDELVNSNALYKATQEWQADLDLLLFGFNVRGRDRYPKRNWWRFWSMPSSHQAIIYSARLLKMEKFDESFRYAADFEHYLRVNKRERKIKIVSEIFALNEPYGSDSHLSSVIKEYHDALIKNGYSKYWAKLVLFLKSYYLIRVLK